MCFRARSCSSPTAARRCCAPATPPGSRPETPTGIACRTARRVTPRSSKSAPGSQATRPTTRISTWLHHPAASPPSIPVATAPPIRRSGAAGLDAFRAEADRMSSATTGPEGAVPSLHPQIQEVLRAMGEAKLRPIEEMTPAEAREQMEATSRARKAEPLPVARVEERMIPGPVGEIRVRLYWPPAAAPVPAIVYYHGGGHVIGSLDTHDF